MSLKQTLKGAIKTLLQGELKIGRQDYRPFDPFEQAGLTASCAWEIPTDAKFQKSWDALYASVPWTPGFSTQVWQQGVMERFVTRGKYRLLSASQGDNLLAVLPLSLTDGGALESAGWAVCDYLDPLVTDDPDAASAAWRIILGLLTQLWDRSVNRLILHNLSQQSKTRQVLANVAADAGFILEESPQEPTVQVALPATFEDYWESLDGHERRETRRRLRKAETQGNARLTTITDPAQIPAALETALDLMEARGGEKAEDIRKYVRPLLLAVAPPLIATGQLQLRLLYINDIPIGCTTSFPTSRGTLSYNVGFDPNQKQWSPGTVASAIAIREAIERGDKVFDFLRGTEEYKYRLGGKDVPLIRLTLTRA